MLCVVAGDAAIQIQTGGPGFNHVRMTACHVFVIRRWPYTIYVLTVSRHISAADGRSLMKAPWSESSTGVPYRHEEGLAFSRIRCGTLEAHRISTYMQARPAQLGLQDKAFPRARWCAALTPTVSPLCAAQCAGTAKPRAACIYTCCTCLCACTQVRTLQYCSSVTRQ